MTTFCKLAVIHSLVRHRSISKYYTALVDAGVYSAIALLFELSEKIKKKKNSTRVAGATAAATKNIELINAERKNLNR